MFMQKSPMDDVLSNYIHVYTIKNPIHNELNCN